MTAALARLRPRAARPALRRRPARGRRRPSRPGPGARGSLGIHGPPPGRAQGRAHAARPAAPGVRGQRRLPEPRRPSHPTCSVPAPATPTISSTWTPSAPIRSRRSRAWKPRTSRDSGRTSRPRAALPWKIDEVYRALVQAFRDRDTPRVLAQAATLCHLIADVHVPSPRHRQLRRPAHRRARPPCALGVRPRRAQPPAARDGGGAGGGPAHRGSGGTTPSGCCAIPIFILCRCSPPTASPSPGGTSRRRRRTSATTTSTTRASTRARLPGWRPGSELPRPPPARCG